MTHPFLFPDNTSARPLSQTAIAEPANAAHVWLNRPSHSLPINSFEANATSPSEASDGLRWRRYAYLKHPNNKEYSFSSCIKTISCFPSKHLLIPAHQHLSPPLHFFQKELFDNQENRLLNLLKMPISIAGKKMTFEEHIATLQAKICGIDGITLYDICISGGVANEILQGEKNAFEDSPVQFKFNDLDLKIFIKIKNEETYHEIKLALIDLYHSSQEEVLFSKEQIEALFLKKNKTITPNNADTEDNFAILAFENEQGPRIEYIWVDTQAQGWVFTSDSFLISLCHKTEDRHVAICQSGDFRQASFDLKYKILRTPHAPQIRNGLLKYIDNISKGHVTQDDSLGQAFLKKFLTDMSSQDFNSLLLSYLSNHFQNSTEGQIAFLTNFILFLQQNYAASQIPHLLSLFRYINTSNPFLAIYVSLLHKHSQEWTTTLVCFQYLLSHCSQRPPTGLNHPVSGFYFDYVKHLGYPHLRFSSVDPNRIITILINPNILLFVSQLAKRASFQSTHPLPEEYCKDLLTLFNFIFPKFTHTEDSVNEDPKQLLRSILYLMEGHLIQNCSYENGTQTELFKWILLRDFYRILLFYQVSFGESKNLNTSLSSVSIQINSRYSAKEIADFDSMNPFYFPTGLNQNGLRERLILPFSKQLIEIWSDLISSKELYVRSQTLFQRLKECGQINFGLFDLRFLENNLDENRLKYWTHELIDVLKRVKFVQDPELALIATKLIWIIKILNPAQELELELIDLIPRCLIACNRKHKKMYLHNIRLFLSYYSLKGIVIRPLIHILSVWQKHKVFDLSRAYKEFILILLDAEDKALNKLALKKFHEAVQITIPGSIENDHIFMSQFLSYQKNAVELSKVNTPLITTPEIVSDEKAIESNTTNQSHDASEVLRTVQNSEEATSNELFTNEVKIILEQIAKEDFLDQSEAILKKIIRAAEHTTTIKSLKLSKEVLLALLRILIHSRDSHFSKTIEDATLLLINSLKEDSSIIDSCWHPTFLSSLKILFLNEKKSLQDFAITLTASIGESHFSLNEQIQIKEWEIEGILIKFKCSKNSKKSVRAKNESFASLINHFSKRFVNLLTYSQNIDQTKCLILWERATREKLLTPSVKKKLLEAISLSDNSTQLENAFNLIIWEVSHSPQKEANERNKSYFEPVFEKLFFSLINTSYSSIKLFWEKAIQHGFFSQRQQYYKQLSLVMNHLLRTDLPAAFNDALNLLKTLTEESNQDLYQLDDTKKLLMEKGLCIRQESRNLQSSLPVFYFNLIDFSLTLSNSLYLKTIPCESENKKQKSYHWPLLRLLLNKDKKCLTAASKLLIYFEKNSCWPEECSLEERESIYLKVSSYLNKYNLKDSLEFFEAMLLRFSWEAYPQKEQLYSLVLKAVDQSFNLISKNEWDHINLTINVLIALMKFNNKSALSLVIKLLDRLLERRNITARIQVCLLLQEMFSSDLLGKDILLAYLKKGLIDLNDFFSPIITEEKTHLSQCVSVFLFHPQTHIEIPPELIEAVLIAFLKYPQFNTLKMANEILENQLPDLQTQKKRTYYLHTILGLAKLKEPPALELALDICLKHFLHHDPIQDESLIIESLGEILSQLSTLNQMQQICFFLAFKQNIEGQAFQSTEFPHLIGLGIKALENLAEHSLPRPFSDNDLAAISQIFTTIKNYLSMPQCFQHHFPLSIQFINALLKFAHLQTTCYACEIFERLENSGHKVNSTDYATTLYQILESFLLVKEYNSSEYAPDLQAKYMFRKAHESEIFKNHPEIETKAVNLILNLFIKSEEVDEIEYGAKLLKQVHEKSLFSKEIEEKRAVEILHRVIELNTPDVMYAAFKTIIPSIGSLMPATVSQNVYQKIFQIIFDLKNTYLLISAILFLKNHTYVPSGKCWELLAKIFASAQQLIKNNAIQSKQIESARYQNKKNDPVLQLEESYKKENKNLESLIIIAAQLIRKLFETEHKNYGKLVKSTVITYMEIAIHFNLQGCYEASDIMCLAIAKNLFSKSEAKIGAISKDIIFTLTESSRIPLIEVAISLITHVQKFLNNMQYKHCLQILIPACIDLRLSVDNHTVLTTLNSILFEAYKRMDANSINNLISYYIECMCIQNLDYFATHASLFLNESKQKRIFTNLALIKKAEQHLLQSWTKISQKMQAEKTQLLTRITQMTENSTEPQSS